MVSYKDGRHYFPRGHGHVVTSYFDRNLKVDSSDTNFKGRTVRTYFSYLSSGFGTNSFTPSRHGYTFYH